MSIESGPDQQDHDERAHREQGFLRFLGRQGRNKELTDADFGPIDFLRGVRNQEEWEALRREELGRSGWQRAKTAFVRWLTLPDPNLTTGETRVDLEPWEMREPAPPLSKSDQEALDEVVAAMANYEPSKDDRYNMRIQPEEVPVESETQP